MRDLALQCNLTVEPASTICRVGSEMYTVIVGLPGGGGTSGAGGRTWLSPK